MSLRLITFACLSVCAASAAFADLDITLNGRPQPVLDDPAPKAAAPKSAPAPVAQKAAPNPSPIPPALRTPTIRRGSLPSRSMPQQIGVIRRGAPPVLPAVTAPIGPEVTPAGPKQIAVNARLGRMLAPATDVYRLPDPRSKWVARVKQGQQVAIVSQWQGWFAVVMGDGSQAYVPQTSVEVLPYEVKTITLAPRPAPPPAPVPSPAPDVTPAGFSEQFEPPTSVLAQRVIQEAFRYVGTPYVYGGNSESGIDCSGLVRNCYAALGLKLPRRASEQVRIGDPVPLDQLQPGDRLYFSVSKAYDHTGIYLGNGYFIHAGRSRGKVGVDHLSTPLYGKNLSAARRS